MEEKKRVSARGLTIICQFVFTWLTIQLFVIAVWLFARGSPVHPLTLIPSWIFTVISLVFTLTTFSKEYEAIRKTPGYNTQFGNSFAMYYTLWIKVMGLLALAAMWVVLYLYMTGEVQFVYVFFPPFFGSLILVFIGCSPHMYRHMEEEQQQQYHQSTTKKASAGMLTEETDE